MYVCLKDWLATMLLVYTLLLPLQYYYQPRTPGTQKLFLSLVLVVMMVVFFMVVFFFFFFLRHQRLVQRHQLVRVRPRLQFGNWSLFNELCIVKSSFRFRHLCFTIQCF